MDIHKEKCRQLKKIRKTIADKIGVDLHQRECTFTGKCAGTCPKCKQEEEILNKALLQRTAVVGAATTMSLGLVGCTLKNQPIDSQLSGDISVAMPTSDEEYNNNKKALNLITKKQNEVENTNNENNVNNKEEKNLVIEKNNIVSITNSPTSIITPNNTQTNTPTPTIKPKNNLEDLDDLKGTITITPIIIPTTISTPTPTSTPIIKDDKKNDDKEIEAPLAGNIEVVPTDTPTPTITPIIIDKPTGDMEIIPNETPTPMVTPIIADKPTGDVEIIPNETPTPTLIIIDRPTGMLIENPPMPELTGDLKYNKP